MSLVRLAVLAEDGSRSYAYPADVRGPHTRLRRVAQAVWLSLFFAVPWLTFGGRPLCLVDLGARRLFLAGMTFNAQDTHLAFFALTALGFVLIALAAFYGRAYCGFACPQTVVLDGLYRPIERLFEGGAGERRALAKGPMTPGKLARKTAKHLAYVALSVVIAAGITAYFVPPRDAASAVLHHPFAHPSVSLPLFALAALTYGNFWWFREQVCLVVCPYGRLQSVLQDRDTRRVGYDAKRGEPRGKVGEAGAGGCINCLRCIAVCPTQMDIRDGSQLDCVGCTACIDACDEMMDRVGRPAGLIRWDDDRGLAGEPRRGWRPRVLVYLGFAAVGAAAASYAILSRHSFEANVTRLGAMPYVLEPDGVRQQALLHLVSKRPEGTRFELAVDAPPGSRVTLPGAFVELEGQGERDIPLVVISERGAAGVRRVVRITVSEARTGEHRELLLPLVGPSP